jgi:hypothetical protein
MKKFVFIIIYILISILFWRISSNDILSSINLKYNNIKLKATIMEISETGNKPRKLQLLLRFSHNGNNYERNVIVGKPLFNKYSLGRKIAVLYSDEENLLYPEESINKSIFNKIFYLIIILPLGCTFIIYTGFYRFITRVKGKNQDNYIFDEKYKIYSQDKDYKIDDIYSSSFISIDIIKNNVDLYKLKDNEMVCYGVMKGENFVEISYHNNQYNLRIFSNGREKFIDLDGNIIKGYFERINSELGNGA